MWEAICNNLIASIFNNVIATIIVSGFIVAGGAFVIQSVKRSLYFQRRALRKVFGFPKNEPVIIVVPEWKSIVEQTNQISLVSWEDMLAVNYVMTSLISAGWHEDKIQIKILKNNEELCEQRNQNLVLLCRPDRNGETHKVLEKLKDNNRLDYPFQKTSIQGQFKLRLDNSPFISPSYKEAKNISGNAYEECKEIHDRALIARFVSPWQSTKKVLLLAGIRAFGTWGAAQALRTKPQELYKLIRKKDIAIVMKCKFSGMKIGDITFEYHFPK